jgi:6-phosphogluconolactonase
VRETLLRDRAAARRFFGLKNPALSPDLGATAARNALARIPRPADITVRGMGDDGHMASLFPGSPNLKSALDLEASEGCIGMWSPSTPHARLSLNLRALLDSRRIFILILGEAKLRTYAAACGPGPVEEMPVRAVLRQQQVPVEVVWAPSGMPEAFPDNNQHRRSSALPMPSESLPSSEERPLGSREFANESRRLL